MCHIFPIRIYKSERVILSLYYIHTQKHLLFKDSQELLHSLPVASVTKTPCLIQTCTVTSSTCDTLAKITASLSQILLTIGVTVAEPLRDSIVDCADAPLGTVALLFMPRVNFLFFDGFALENVKW